MWRRGLCLVLFAAAAAHAAAAGEDRVRTQYLLHCSGCHQADGSGSPGNGIPRMRGQVGHFLRLAEGRDFLVQVPGSSQSSLGDADLAALLNWMVGSLSGAEVPADFVPYTRDEVARLRARPLSDASAARRQVVKRLRGMGYPVD